MSNTNLNLNIDAVEEEKFNEEKQHQKEDFVNP